MNGNGNELPAGKRLTSGAVPGGGDPGIFMILVVGIVASVIIVSMIICLRAMYEQAQQGENTRKAASLMPPEIAAAVAKQQEQLNRYAVIDPKTGAVAIPIERAMDLAAAELNAPAGTRPTAPPPANRSAQSGTTSN